jgi:hypothetical protein
MFQQVNICEEIQGCRLCNSSQLEVVLDFGSTAFANSYLNKDELTEWEITAPLRVVKCVDCGSVQLKDTVLPHLLFCNYQYESSTSGTLKNHFVEYANELIKSLQLTSNDLVIDIGGNDGVLLRPLKEKGINVLNVEPAQNLATKCRAEGINTINNFFDVQVAKTILEKYGRPRVITCNNCFAHVPKLDSIIEGLKILMGPETIFIFENAYLLDTIKGKYFDQVYHEHTFYHSIKPLVKYFETQGFTLWSVNYNNNQGGSFRAYVTKGDIYSLPSVDVAIENEEKAGLYNTQTYFNLWLDIKKKRKDLQHLLNDARGRGKKIVAYGAPAKFTTFTSVLGIDQQLIEYVVEDAPNKIGKFTPGNHLEIKSAEQLYTDNPDYILITAWNFAEFIMKKHDKFKGKFIVPFPEIRIL